MFKLEILLATIFGLFIVFSVIALFIMCTVGCIQCHKRKQAQRSRQRNRRGLNLPQRNMETQDQPTEQDHDEEENEEDRKTRDLSQAPPPAYRNANQYLNVDLEHAEVVQMSAMYKISTHSEEQEVPIFSPPQYNSVDNDSTEAYLPGIPNSSMTYAGENQIPSPYSTPQREPGRGKVDIRKDIVF